MDKILRKRIIRDLKDHFLRYAALCLLIILGCYMLVSLLAAAENIIQGTKEHQLSNRMEDGQFTTFTALNAKEEQVIRDKGISLERAFYYDVRSGDGSTIRIFRNRRMIDLIECDEGRIAENPGEAVLEKRFCEVKGLRIGDAIDLGGDSCIITGIGTVPDYESPLAKMSDSIVDSESFGLAFVTPEQYEHMLSEGHALESESFVYAYHLNGTLTHDELKDLIESFEFDYKDVEDPWFREYISEQMGAAESVRDFLSSPLFSNDNDVTKLLDMLDPNIHNLQQLIAAEENMRIGTAGDDVQINKSSCLFAGIIVLALFAYCIAVFVIHEIDDESEVIGALYALGVKKSELIRHYTIMPMVITFLGGLIGTALGYSPAGCNFQMSDSYLYFSIPEISVRIFPYIIIYGIAVPPVISLIVNYLVIRKKLSRPVLSLLRHEKKRGRIHAIRLDRFGFITRFQIRQMLRELRGALTVLAGLTVSLMLVFIGVNCWVMCGHVKADNVTDTRFAYMYTYKYPEQTVPKGGEPACAVTLSRASFGYEFDVTLLGIEEDTPYFDLDLRKNREDVMISSAMAQKFGFTVGEEIVLEDRENDQLYAFRVSGITQYSPGFFVFMDLETMRDMFGFDEDYYNVVFADKALDIPSGRLYSTLDKEKVIASAGVFVELMYSMIYIMIGVSVIIFIIVMYLMLGVMVDNSSYDISLMKIFGYKRSEIRKLYLNGNFYIVAIGTLIVLPLSKLIINSLYPYFISNVTCAMDLSMSPLVYVGIYIAIIAIYLLVSFFLNRKIDAVSIQEVLKNRE